MAVGSKWSQQKCDGIIFVLGGGLSADGSQLGNGTMARCDVAIEEAQRHFKHPCFVLNAGFAPDIEPQPKHTMAELMEGYITERLPADYVERIRFERDNTWGSVGEVDALRLCMYILSLPRKIYVISSSYHLPRLWIIFHVVFERYDKLDITYVGTWKNTKIRSVLWECLKLPGYVIRCLLGRRAPAFLVR